MVWLPATRNTADHEVSSQLQQPLECICYTLGRPSARNLTDPYAERPSGRGTVEDSDEPLGRRAAEAEPLQKQQPWEAKKLNEEQVRNNPIVIPAELRPK